MNVSVSERSRLIVLSLFNFILQVKDQIESQLNNMIINYRDDPDLQNLVDWVQKDWVSE